MGIRGKGANPILEGRESARKRAGAPAENPSFLRGERGRDYQLMENWWHCAGLFREAVKCLEEQLSGGERGLSRSMLQGD